MHLIWAVLLIMSPAPTTVTGLNLLYNIFPNRYLLAAILIVTSVVAILAVVRYKGVTSLLLLLPQQFMLIVPAIAVLQAIGNASFADGVTRPRAFLTADKVSVVLLAIFHSISLARFHKLDEEL